MENYIERLMMCGYSLRDAAQVVGSFCRELDRSDLEQYIALAEANKDSNEYVAGI